MTQVQHSWTTGTLEWKEGVLPPLREGLLLYNAKESPLGDG